MDCKVQIMQLTKQVDNIFATLDQSKPKCTKRGIIHFLFNFLFGNSSSAKEINAIKNMAILKEKQNTLNSQIHMTFNFINLTYTETDTNRLLRKALQKDIWLINNTVYHLSKKLISLFMFQLRSHLATLCNGINSVKNILSILDLVSITSLQKLESMLLNPLDLKSLLTKLEPQLVLHPRLAPPLWNGENIWYMYKFMKLRSLMMSDTLYAVLYIPMVDINHCNLTFIKYIISHWFILFLKVIEIFHKGRIPHN